MYRIALIATLLLSACAGTVGSKDAVCSIPAPQLDPEGISTENLMELDLFSERLTRACS
jgi:hypothetical protein